MNYWLFKTEPGTYSIDDLQNERDRRTTWEGIRNYAARNNLQAARKGDLVFIYHSAANPPHIAGIAKIVKEAYPDHFAFDPKSDYYDPKSDPNKPRWFMVDIKFVDKLKRPVLLEEIKKKPELAEMALLKIGRLSVTPVRAAEWQTILKMAG